MEKGKLYLIPTPIGNLDDITLRTIKTLEMIDILFCEDTRETGLLMAHLNLKKKMISNHLHNELENVSKAEKFIEEGLNVGIVSDRGMPIVSDPGFEIVKDLSVKDVDIVALPGANALLPALIASGIAPQPFTFFGFLNSKEEKRKKELEELKNMNSTLIFYESPHRLLKTLGNMQEVLGNREISISREISKKFEEHIRGNLVDIKDKIKTVKGEIVIVVEGNKINKKLTDEEIVKCVNFYLPDAKNTNDAIKKVAKELKLNKNEVYKIYHNL